MKFLETLDEALDEVLFENIEKKKPHIMRAILKDLRKYWPQYPQYPAPRRTPVFGTRGPLDATDFLASLEEKAQGWWAQKHGGPALDGTDYIMPYIEDIFIPWLVVADPVASRSNGRKTPYVNIIMEWILNSEIGWYSDWRDRLTEATKISKLLMRYQYLTKTRGIRLPNPETTILMKFRDAVESMQGDVGPEEKFMTLNDFNVYEVKGDADSEYDLEYYEKMQDMLCDSGWCVRNAQTLRNYTKEGSLYLITKSVGHGMEKRYALAFPARDELKNNQNTSLSDEEMIPIIPIIRKVFPELERTILNDVERGYDFDSPDLSRSAHLFPDIAILAEPDKLANFTENLNGPWPGEIIDKILTVPAGVHNVIEMFSKQGTHERLPEIEQNLLKTTNPLSLYYITAMYFANRDGWPDNRWPELEKVLLSLKGSPRLGGDPSAGSGDRIERAMEKYDEAFMRKMDRNWYNDLDWLTSKESGARYIGRALSDKYRRIYGNIDKLTDDQKNALVS